MTRIEGRPGNAEATNEPTKVQADHNGSLLSVLDIDPHADNLTGVLEPPLLRQRYTDAIEKYWDADAYRAVLVDEADDLAELDGVLNKFGDAR